MSTAKPLLDAALGYARRGWLVLPLHSPAGDGRCSCDRPDCAHPGKHPRTPHGFKDATTDQATIRDWWRRWPHANVGIATGKTSGIAVVDIDRNRGGMESLRGLEAQHGDLPLTAVVRTGNGNHHYFQYPGIHVKSIVGRGDLYGIDVRGDGGYVVAPPSWHASRTQYLWESELEQVQLAPLPAWLLERFSLSDAPPDLADPSPAGAPIQEGQRNSTLTSLAGTMRRRGMIQAEIEAALLAVNTSRCTPPLAPHEVTEIARSVARYPDSAKTANSANQERISTEWEPPTPFHRFPRPPFPTAALPGWLRRFVEGLSLATQTPPDLPGMLSLSVVAAASAKRVAVRVREGWIEPINLYVVVVLDPGERKTPVFNAMAAPLEEHEREESRRMADEIAAAKNQMRIAEQTLKKMQDRAARAKPEQREILVNEADRLARGLMGMRVPAEPRFLADDTTPERLATLLDEQNGRMAVMSDEGGIFDLMAGRYSNNNTPNFEVYLKGHAGSTLRVDRVGRSRDYVHRPALTIGLTIQPEVLRGLMSKAGFRGRGLLGRFLYSFPEGRMGGRDVDPPPVPPSVQEAYRQGALGLLAQPIEVDDAGNPVELLLDLEDQAREVLLEFARCVEPQLAPHGDLGIMTDWGGKLVGAVVRVVGVLHMAEHASDPAPWDRPIRAQIVRKAIQIGSYVIAHAKAAYAEMGADPAVADAKHLLEWLERSGSATFTKRDAFEGTKGRFKKVPVMEPGLALLEVHGYIRKRPTVDREGPGRKPSPTYDVNPVWLSQNAHNSQNDGTTDDSANSAKSVSAGGEPTDGDEAGSPDLVPADHAVDLEEA